MLVLLKATVLLLLVCAFCPPDVCVHQVLTYLHGHQRTSVIITNVNDADAAEKKDYFFGDLLEFILCYCV